MVKGMLDVHDKEKPLGKKIVSDVGLFLGIFKIVFGFTFVKGAFELDWNI